MNVGCTCHSQDNLGSWSSPVSLPETGCVDVFHPAHQVHVSETPGMLHSPPPTLTEPATV